MSEENRPLRSRTKPWYTGKTTEELDDLYREREKVANRCSHPERRGLMRNGTATVDICMSCGETRRDGRRIQVSFVPKDYAHADSMLKVVVR